jgi:hypothetical protein
VELPRHQLGGFESSEVTGFRVVMEKAYDFFAKYVILCYIYPAFVGENSSGDFLFIARFFLYFIYSLQVRDIEDWSADNPVFHVGS